MCEFRHLRSSALVDTGYTLWSNHLFQRRVESDHPMRGQSFGPFHNKILKPLCLEVTCLPHRDRTRLDCLICRYFIWPFQWETGESFVVVLNYFRSPGPWPCPHKWISRQLVIIISSSILTSLPKRDSKNFFTKLLFTHSSSRWRTLAYAYEKMHSLALSQMALWLRS